MNSIVTISDYMKSRRYNHKQYKRLIDKIEESLDEDEEVSYNLEIGMSAKYQTPYISFSSKGDTYFVEECVLLALDEIGFRHVETEIKGDKFFMEFDDMG